MSNHISNPLPATKFPKLDEVARRQRHIKRVLTFMALAAIASAMVSLVGCSAGGDDPAQSAVDAMNSGDDDAIDAFLSQNAQQALIRLNVAAGPRPLRYRLVHVQNDGSRATLAAAPEGAVEASYLVELDFAREDGIVERLSYSPASARW